METNDHVSYFDILADGFSFDKNVDAFLASTFGDDTNLRVDQNKSNLKIPLITSSKYGTGIRISEGSSKLDKLTVGVISRFIYPGILGIVEEVLPNSSNRETNSLQRSSSPTPTGGWENFFDPVDITSTCGTGLTIEERSGGMGNTPSNNFRADGTRRSTLLEVIETRLMNLSEREQIVLQTRFGYLGHKPRTVTETARDLDLTSQEVLQIERKAINQLKTLAHSGLTPNYSGPYNAFLHGKLEISFINDLLALRKGANHFDNEKVVDSFVERLMDDYNGDKSINLSLTLEQILKEARSSWMQKTACTRCHTRQPDGSKFKVVNKKDKKFTNPYVVYQLLNNRDMFWSHNCPQAGPFWNSRRYPQSWVILPWYLPNEWLDGLEISLIRTLWLNIMCEVAGRDSKSPVASDIFQEFFQKGSDYIHGAQEIAEAFVNTSFIISTILKDKKSSAPNLTKKVREPDDEYRSQLAVISDTSESMKKNNKSLKSNVSSKDHSSEVKEIVALYKENEDTIGKVRSTLTELIDEKYGDKKEIFSVVETNDDQQVTEVIEKSVAIFASSDPYLVETSGNHIENRERPIEIFNVQSAGFGDEDFDMPLPGLTGSPTSKVWQLEYGNMEVFNNIENQQPEIVVLLDHSSSMEHPQGFQGDKPLDIAWSVAMTIKQAYPNTRIYPYSTFGIYTGTIELGTVVPDIPSEGTPTPEALIWVKKRFYENLDRVNVLLISDDEQPYGTGELCASLRGHEGMRIGVCKVGEGSRGSYQKFPADFYAEVKTRDDVSNVQEVINGIMQDV